jgi:hypothetical protein
MGAVQMGRGANIKIDGANISPVIYCIYCDECGSFKIKKTLSIKNWVWISIGVVIATIFWMDARDGALPGAYLVCLGSSLLMVYFIGGFDTEALQCMKCGNRHITKTNVLGYPANDKRILDVPYSSTEKFADDEY